MNETVLLVAVIFLDFSAALILLVPIYRFSYLTNSLSAIQTAIINFGFIPRSISKETAIMHDELMYDMIQSHSDNEKLSRQMIKYEKDFIPYGITILGIGFVFIVIGTIWDSLV